MVPDVKCQELLPLKAYECALTEQAGPPSPPQLFKGGAPILPHTFIHSDLSLLFVMQRVMAAYFLTLIATKGHDVAFKNLFTSRQYP